MADRVDASVHSVKVTRLDAADDGALSDASRDQLGK
jgi:hypothetical protein